MARWVVENRSGWQEFTSRAHVRLFLDFWTITVTVRPMRLKPHA
ncbi:hypothetical protein [Acidiferrobacter sp.]|nr:hypothetical protein [Acidiferrobacter sp.]